MTDRYLVTGGSGYFGLVLANALHAKGLKVRIFDRIPPCDLPPDLEFMQGDIRHSEQVRAACSNVTVIHHNAAVVPLARDKAAFNAVNVDGTRNLLAAALDAKVRKVVYTSSSAVFGVPASNPVTDATPPRPAEAYGRSKFEGEELCRDFAKHGLDVSIIRPRTIMGQGRLGIMQILFEWVYQGRNIPVLGRGDNVYQFIHAEDLASACIAAGELPGNDVYNVGAERYGTLRDTLEGLIAYARSKSRIRELPRWPAEIGMNLTSALGISPLGAYHALMYGHSLYFDISKAKHDLGYQPRYSNIEMFCESYDWYLENRDRILSENGASRHRSAVRQGVLRAISRLL